MKYIIEIEDEPFGRNDDPVIPHGMDELYRAKGFNSLVFDQFGLDKLTPLDKELEEVYQRGLDEGKKKAKVQAHLDVCHDIERVARGNYQKGLDDAWECAKRIVLTKTDANCPYFTVAELEKIFGYSTSQSVFDAYSASEAIKKVKIYEEQQKADEIKVGDEMQADADPSVKIIVSQVNGDTIWGFNSKGTFSSRPNFDWHKTGRHFPQVAELFEAMKGEQRSCSTCKYSDGSDVSKCSDCIYSLAK